MIILRGYTLENPEFVNEALWILQSLKNGKSGLRLADDCNQSDRIAHLPGFNRRRYEAEARPRLKIATETPFLQLNSFPHC